MHKEKDRFTKYGGVFILAHDSFNLILNALHTETFYRIHTACEVRK